MKRLKNIWIVVANETVSVVYSPYLLPNGSRTERRIVIEVFGATCCAGARQPARPPCPLAKVHMPPGVSSRAHCDCDLRSDQLWWERRFTLIPVLGSLSWGGCNNGEVSFRNQSLARITFGSIQWKEKLGFFSHCIVTRCLVAFCYFQKIPKLSQAHRGHSVISPQNWSRLCCIGKRMEFLFSLNLSGGVGLNWT